MATQTGLGISKILILGGTGLAGSVVLKNGRLSDIISEIQSMVTRLDKGGGSLDGNSDNTAVLEAQVRRLAQEVRQLAASRPITIMNGNSMQSGNLASFALPVAALGALGYGYMWWKGLSFTDLMYVTKRNMSNVVSSFTRQLDQITVVIAAAKKHLTQRIENLDGKMDEQKELSVLINNEVVDVRGDLARIGFDVEAIQNLISGLEGKIGTLEDKQDFANAGVLYLCHFVGGAKDGNVSKFLQNFPGKSPAKRSTSAPAYVEAKSMKGLQYIADTIKSGAIEKTKVNAVLQNKIDDLATGKSSPRATEIQKPHVNDRSLSRTCSTGS